MKIHQHCFHNLAVTIFTTIAFYTNLVNAQIVPDTTLPNNSSVTPQDNIQVIEGGTQSGSNLFHSFEQFSIPANTTAYFNNTTNIQNIITRITGKSISNIDGTIHANGMANLFLINPSGILFGENAALDIGGSFFATTATSLNFADGTLFSATQPQTKPLLTVNVPIGLQFGATAAPIRNQSQAYQNDGTNVRNQAVGLQVPTGKTLALIGGDVTLEGGNLTVDSGRIELAAVGSNSFVSLNSIDRGWILGYGGVEKFRNIQFIQRSVNGSKISSNVIVNDKFGSGNIEIQGDLVELVGFNVINLINEIDKNAVDSGNLNITATKLVVRDGMQIISLTIGNSASSSINVNASESVEIIGGIDSNGSYFPTIVANDTISVGKAGNMTINTNRLLIKDGGSISADSSSLIKPESQLLPAAGVGGNIIVNAAESVELIGSSANVPSSLRATTTGFKNGGKLTINTKQLIARDEAEITVSSRLELPPNVTFDGDASNLGNAGELNITADSILLDNQSKLTSETQSANGGNINLQLKNLLLMRRNSQISTNAGIAQLDGDGGNININMPNGFIVAVPLENSDITANAFTGTGGRVNINAAGIFGIKPRSRSELANLLFTNNPSELNPQELLTSDITAISQQNPNLNGILSINATDIEPTRELVELPEIPVDPKISQVCTPRGNQSEFIFSRSGVPPLPGEALSGDSALDVDWVDGERGRRDGERGRRDGERGRWGEGERGRGGDGERGGWGEGEMGRGGDGVRGRGGDGERGEKSKIVLLKLLVGLWMKMAIFILLLGN